MQQNKEKSTSQATERYGTDELYRFLLWTCIILALIRLPFGRSLGGHILLGCTLLIGAVAVLRIFSRNLPARRQENRLFLQARNRLYKWIGLQLLRIKDRHTAAYRVCPECRAVIRLKRRRGEHTVVCPRCATHFDIHIR